MVKNEKKNGKVAPEVFSNAKGIEEPVFAVEAEWEVVTGEAVVEESLPKTTALEESEWSLTAKSFIEQVWSQFQQGRFNLTREQMDTVQKLLS